MGGPPLGEDTGGKGTPKKIGRVAKKLGKGGGKYTEVQGGREGGGLVTWKKGGWGRGGGGGGGERGKKGGGGG